MKHYKSVEFCQFLQYQPPCWRLSGDGSVSSTYDHLEMVSEIDDAHISSHFYKCWSRKQWHAHYLKHIVKLYDITTNQPWFKQQISCSVQVVAFMGVRRNFSGGDKVDIMLILFRLLTMKCKGTFSNALLFLHHKENAPCYSNKSQKCASLAAIAR